jgi:ABC-2 type transport system ATP-binding protein
MSIVVQQVTKKYNTQVAVNNISFDIQQGEIVGFLGPNGAGKSTTMKMLTGYILPNNGNISIAGVNMLTHSIEAKKHIGYLPESNALYIDMYVKEYLQFVAGIFSIKNTANEINNVIDIVGLGNEQHKKIHQLSKGYKQRVGLAATLVHNPSILILDEPTSGLDPNQIVEIRNVIKEQGSNKTVLFSSHILQEVEAICTRIIVINKGNIVADKSIKEFKKMGNNLEDVFRKLTLNSEVVL